MGILLSLFKFPFVARLINTYTTNKKSTITSAVLVGLSIIGVINQEQIQMLSGLHPLYVVPILLLFIIIIYIPKIVNYFNNKKLNDLQLEKAEKEIIIDLLKSDIEIKDLKNKLNG